LKRSFSLLCLMFACGVPSSGQRIGPCPSADARSPEKIKEPRGVVVDENFAVVPKVKVRLQVPDGKDFRNIEATETDPTGHFSFDVHSSRDYRLVFTGPRGFCPATIPVAYSKTGLKGIRVTLPTAATDTCSDYCDSKLKVEGMTGRERRR
jgi:hypothetical protein